MSNPPDSTFRHPELVFKGMPRLRFRRNESLLEHARNSPYYWWWAYLRLSKDYWWVCQRQGVADDIRLRAMYRDFGRVYDQPFDKWWSVKGERLFSQQVELPRVRQLSAGYLELTKPADGHLLLEVPLHMTERTIISQVRRLLRLHPDRDVQRISTAKRELAQLVGIRHAVIESAHAVWRLHYQSRDGREATKVGQVRGAKSLYQIGKELKLAPTCMPMTGDSDERAAKRVNGMKVAVSRMLRRANNLTDNAAVGVFPSVQALRERVTWREVQQRRLDEAVAAGVWRPLFEPHETLIDHKADVG